MKALHLVTLAILLFACKTEKSMFDTSPFLGIYKGTWQNTAAGTSGRAMISIATDKAAHTSSITIDFDGPYLGQMDPPAVTLNGTFDDDRAVCKGTDTLFGTYDVTVEKDGKMSGTFTNLGGGMIPQLIYNGLLTANKIDATYVVTLSDNSLSNGIANLTKQ